MNKPVAPMSSLSLKLPTAGGAIETYRLAASRTFPAKLEGALNRVAFSAAHVVADPLADVDPWLTAAVDWDRTIAFREHVWDLGLGVAEAMDTAQRGMGLDWPTSLELITRSVRAAKARGGALVFSGAGTDHLAVEDAKSLDDVIRAYETQIAAVEKAGGRIILMASRALAKLGRNADDYAKVYNRVLSQVREPVIIHWLGDMFDPALANYWGTKNLDEAMDIAVGIINANAAKVDGVKVSLLDKQREIDMRRRLDKNVKMYTGDDFNYAELIAGDDKGFSHALLGIFDAIAPAASYALSRLAAGDEAGFRDVLGPTVPLSRHIFKAPTRFYKTGIVFMAYLNGHQDHFTMVGGQESTRSTLHLAELFRLADKAGLLANPELATRRMKARAGAARRRTLMRDFSSDHRWLSLNTATVRKQGDLVQIIDACARHGIRAIDPWRDQVAAIGLDRAVRAVRDAGLELSGYCRGGMFTSDAAHRHRGARRQPPRSRRGQGAGRALHRAGGRRLAAIFAAGKRGFKGYCRRAGADRRRHRRDDGICARREHAARDRAAASGLCRRPRLRQHHQAGARHLRPARSASVRACSASRSTSITSGGIRR